MSKTDKVKLYSLPKVTHTKENVNFRKAIWIGNAAVLDGSMQIDM